MPILAARRRLFDSDEAYAYPAEVWRSFGSRSRPSGELAQGSCSAHARSGDSFALATMWQDQAASLVFCALPILPMFLRHEVNEAGSHAIEQLADGLPGPYPPCRVCLAWMTLLTN